MDKDKFVNLALHIIGYIEEEQLEKWLEDSQRHHGFNTFDCHDFLKVAAFDGSEGVE